jgi:hypothetical protein
MPIHDWSRVPAGIFHDFHAELIPQIKYVLNEGVLPPDYYAMAEQVAAGVEPDVLTLHAPGLRDKGGTGRATGPSPEKGGGGVLLAQPKVRSIAETRMDHYRRKKNMVAVRHVSDDRIVAVVEVVSPGNKSTRHALEQFVQKAADFLDRSVHLLIVDLLPPGRHDPQGIHGAIWDFIDGRPYSAPPDKPLTVAAYESDRTIRAYVKPVAVGEVLPEMPLFLEPGGCVEVPLEVSYESAWQRVPWRWKDILELRG